MNFIDFIPSSVVNAIGWTLIHSLWQGAVITIVVAMAQRLIPTRLSSVRYALNCSAMAILFFMAVATFFYIIEPSFPTQVSHYYPILFTSTAESDIQSFNLASAVGFVNSHMTSILWMWVTGVVFFAIRFTGGLVYIHQLKKKVLPVKQQWSDRLIKLKNQLGITSLVKLFESAHISKPMVIGYLKPVILLPVGVLSGLPTQQIEAILIHELIHIKRHDFLINLIQSLMEIVFFFNPFIWVLSSMVRKEREFCCDDQVLNAGSMSIDYVKALANLEEGSFKTPSLAMALGQNKFQVFNRIKRIMENSVNTEPGKVRPVALLILATTALVCVSWLAPERQNNSKIGPDMILSSNVPSDTTSKPEKNKVKEKNKTKSSDKKAGSEESTQMEMSRSDEGKSATYSRRVITTYDEEGNPHEEVIEEYDGDEELKSLFSSPGSFSFAMPAIPAIPAIPSIPSIPSIPDVPFSGSFYYYDDDSIPGFRHFSHRDRDEWEEFGRQMEKNFERFGADSEEFGQMMEAWADDFAQGFQFQFDGFDDDFELQMDDFHDRLEDIHNSDEFNQRLNRGLEELEQNLEKMRERIKLSEEEVRNIDKHFKEYETELNDQLVKDGYLKKGEKVESMSWGDGKLTINGIRIKDADVSKYEALSEKFFKGKRGFYVH